MVYVIKASWAGFVLNELIARSLEEAEDLVEGTEETDGISGRFQHGGYEKTHLELTHVPNVLCVDVICGEKVVKSYNLHRQSR